MTGVDSRTADPSGWNLDAAEEPEDQPIDDGIADNAAPEDDPDGAADVPDEQPRATESSLSRRQQGLAAAGVAAGFAVVGFVAWRLG